MSTVKSRLKAGVHLARSYRMKIREMLLRKYGDRCIWCGKRMIIPVSGKPVPEGELCNMATVEHHFAVKLGDPNNADYYKLAHKKCNK